jgi:hypothetical protein
MTMYCVLELRMVKAVKLLQTNKYVAALPLELKAVLIKQDRIKVYQIVIYTICTQNKREREGEGRGGQRERELNNLQRTRLSPRRMI